MQWKSFFTFLATASCLVRALPTVDPSLPALMRRQPDLGAHVNYQPEDTFNNHQRRAGVISRFSRLRTGDTMHLASGLNIVLHTLIVNKLTTFTLPGIGQVTDNLDAVGRALDIQRVMTLAYSLSTGRRITVTMEWNKGQQISPNLTAPEFQAIIIAMWRTMQELTEDWCEAQFDFGFEHILSIVLRYT